MNVPWRDEKVTEFRELKKDGSGAILLVLETDGTELLSCYDH